MGVNLNDLPPHLRSQARAQLAAQPRRAEHAAYLERRQKAEEIG